MGTIFEHDTHNIFDIIIKKYDIKYEDILKRCIRNVLSDWDNRYLSIAEYDYEKALLYDTETIPQERYEVWDAEYDSDIDCYSDLSFFRNNLHKAVEEDFNAKISKIMEMYQVIENNSHDSKS